MTSFITMQQDFLPTDAQFGEPPAILDWFGIGFGVWMALMIAAIAILNYSATLPQKTSQVKAGVFLGFAVVTGIVFMSCLVSMTNDYSAIKQEAREVAKENLIQNIHSVYDVELIKELDNRSTSPDNSPEILVIQDDVAYEVVLKQNPETYEPTLVMIASAGSDITELRKK